MASLYPALYRMLRKGWVEASLGGVTDRAQAALLPPDEEWPSPNSTISQEAGGTLNTSMEFSPRFSGHFYGTK
jgi:hypothetical protein